MRSNINLSESIVVALESIKQALEVFHGFEVAFDGDLQIAPRKIRKFSAEGRAWKSRSVMITGKYRQRWGGNSVRIYADVDLNNQGSGWHADRIHFGLGELESPGHSWCIAHWGFKDDDANTVRVIVEMGEGSDNKNWRVGHGHSDRRLEPFFPRVATTS